MKTFLILIILFGFSCNADLVIYGELAPDTKSRLDSSTQDSGLGKPDSSKDDEIAPIVTLNGDNPMFLPANEEYLEPGANAVDNIDGVVDVTIEGTVDSSKLGDYKITYLATDKAGNTATQTRDISVIDTGPAITLRGRNPVLLDFGQDSYSELGAVAIDDIDGEVNVTISGSVDDQSIGVYEIIYSAQDSAGHMSSEKRVVVVSNIRIGPYLQNATPTSIVVMWETPDEDESTVEYGLTDQLGQTQNGSVFTNQGNAKIHTVNLEGLTPDTVYYYRVKTGASIGAINHFRSVSEDREGRSNFIVYSDMQAGGNADLHGRIVDESMSVLIPTLTGEKNIIDGLDFILAPGDLVNTGDRYSDWKGHFFDEAQSLIQNIPFYAVLGNHEENSQNFYDFMDNPKNGSPDWQDRWYYFDHANIRVISLDTNAYYGDAETEQLEWLGPVLASACDDDKIDFVFAQFHHAHISELWPPGESGVATDIVQRLIKFSDDCNKASVHFYGHTHGYQRGQNRDHAHFYMNVAAGEGDLDRWGEYDSQYNSDVIQTVIVQWGWSYVESKGGNDPTFTMRHIGVGGDSDNFDFPGTEVDALTYRPKSLPPEKPNTMSPSNENIMSSTVRLEASNFVPKEADAKHLAVHFQVTQTTGNYESLVEEQWFRFEDFYFDSNLNQNIDLTKSKEFDLNNRGVYFWRVRYRDTGFKWSDWSTEATFTW